MTATPQERWYAGERLGLPESGPGSVAGWGRRVIAVFLDWALSLMFVAAFVGSDVWSSGGVAQWAPLVTFAVQRWVLTSMLGGSAAQLMLGLRVVRTSGGRVDPGRLLVRTVLLCLVIPAVIYNRDRQGLHDLAVDTIAVRS